MKMKNDCQVDYIKDVFDKLYNRVMPYIDLTQFSDADAAFKELDKKVHSEIYILKKCLAESDRAVEAGITRSKVLQERISDLEKELNNERKHGEDLADVNGQLASENVDLKARLTLFEHSRITWRARAQHAEKEVEDLNKKISDLEEENANLRVTPFDTLEALKKENSELEKQLAQARNSTELHLREENDRLREVVNTLEKDINALKKKVHELEEENSNLRATPADTIRIKSLERANKILRRENGTLWTTLEKRDIGERTCYKSLSETIEFQNKKNEELEAENIALSGDNKKLASACEEIKHLREIIDRNEKEINTLKKKIHELEEENISKRPWHGDGNAMTDIRTCHKSLVETIEELKAKKARLEENVDLSYGHEFEFGDEVFVPWSDAPYMYIKSGQLYNPRTERLVYVGKDQHLKWFGEKFSIV